QSPGDGRCDFAKAQLHFVQANFRAQRVRQQRVAPAQPAYGRLALAARRAVSTLELIGQVQAGRAVQGSKDRPNSKGLPQGAELERAIRASFQANGYLRNVFDQSPEIEFVESQLSSSVLVWLKRERRITGHFAIVESGFQVGDRKTLLIGSPGKIHCPDREVL